MAASEHEYEHWMSLACEAALEGLNTATPNPRVGCVLVGQQGKLISKGFHAKAGQDHAEVVALKNAEQAGQSVNGATAYVTLEPCNHQGLTGPCSQALVQAGVGKVVFGMQDPNPKVAGAGLETLRQAGIEVIGPVLEDKAAALNPGFIKRMQTGLPWVRCKLAMSLDGRTAMATGESQWITGPDARADVQAWRARSCAMVTGIGTVQADDPELTVRDPLFGESPRQPTRVIVDSRLRCSFEERIFNQPGNAVVATTALVQPGQHPVPVWTLPSDHAKVDLEALLRRMVKELSCNEVLIEAGSQLAGGFAQRGLIDEYIIYVAPKILGSQALPLLTWPLNAMAEAQDLTIASMTPIGRDWRVIATPVSHEALLTSILEQK